MGVFYDLKLPRLILLLSLASPKVFERTCGTLFEKMIDTVPTGVNLTDPITLLPVKVAGVQLSVASTGSLNLQVSLRVSRFTLSHVPHGAHNEIFSFSRPTPNEK